ncbi:MAG: hypothetical protein Q8J92_09235 [Parvibaculum sp.]|nr:hypothetical protein [Parvibaculum sp.]
MRKVLAAILTVLLPVWMPATVSASDLFSAGPLATAVQIRGHHANSGTAGYRIVYETATDGKKTAPSEILLAADYIEIKNKGRHAIVDFKLRRLIQLYETERSFANLSLYGDVAFRMAEAINRQYLRQVLQGMDFKATSNAVDAFDPFWAGAELGLADPAEPHPEIDRRTDADGTIRFSYKGKEVAVATPSDRRVPAALQKRSLQALRSIASLHPDILDAIATDGRLPQNISYIRRPPNGEEQQVTLTLSSEAVATASYPLPAGYTSDLMRDFVGGPDNEALGTLMPVMLQAIAGTYGSGPRTTASYKAAIGQAMDSGRSFHALVLALELSLQRGEFLQSCGPADASCYTFPNIVTAARSDSRGSALLRSLELDQTDPAAATREREGIDRRDVPSGYLIGAFLGNGLVTQNTRRPEARQLLHEAMRGNPYVASFYKDLGDYHSRAFEYPTAWLLYDLGRLVPERSRAESDPLNGVDGMERHLVANFGQFF